jgi:hypothetical protein
MPPTEAAYDSGTRICRRVAGVLGGQLSAPQFRR